MPTSCREAERMRPRDYFVGLTREQVHGFLREKGWRPVAWRPVKKGECFLVDWGTEQQIKDRLAILQRMFSFRTAYPRLIVQRVGKP